jgi:dTMP kinase
VADVIGSHRSAVVRRRAAGATSYDEASERFFDILEARAVNDPEVAAYFLSGLSDPRAHELRRQLADRAAAVVADGLRGLGDEPSWQLREQLAEVVPFHVARSIEGPAVEGSRAEAMRTRFAGDQPEAVLATLDGIDTRAAWTLRHQLARGRLRAVTGSLRGLDGEEAWALRDSYLAQAGAGEEAVAALALVTRTLSGIATPRAWALRQRCIEVAPSAALWSLEGLNDEASWQMRLAYVGHAPKIVLRTFDGSDDPRGWQMRREHAVRVKEALDSMIGLDHPVAWELREQCADIWPSTVFKSLGAIAGSARGRQLGERLLQQYPDNVSLLKHVTHYAHLASRPTSVRNAG